jgi:hypothetical protein
MESLWPEDVRLGPKARVMVYTLYKYMHDGGRAGREGGREREREREGEGGRGRRHVVRYMRSSCGGDTNTLPNVLSSDAQTPTTTHPPACDEKICEDMM